MSTRWKLAFCFAWFMLCPGWRTTIPNDCFALLPIVLYFASVIEDKRQSIHLFFARTLSSRLKEVT